MVGVLLLLTALAGFTALRTQDSRTGWLATSPHNHRPNTTDPTVAPLWWRRSTDQFHNQTIVRVDVAATGPNSPRPPGIPTLPTAGQYYASPAMARLLAHTPPDQLAQRYPGRLIGIIGDSALASPDTLLIIVGQNPQQLATVPGAVAVRSIETAPTRHSFTTFQHVALGIAAAGLLVPILVFVAMATRIAAARREQRLAAMRLVGATMRQIAVLASVEAALAGLLGTLAAASLFYLLRPALARIPLTGQSWFTSDLTLHPVTLAVVMLAVPLAAAATAVAALGRVRLTPLGVTRRITPTPPTARRLIPLGLGLLILTVFALAGHPYDRGAASSYAPTIVVGFALTLAGLAIAGPFLTLAITRLFTLRANRPATLLAGRRLADDPAAAFRAVSGVILAVFVGSVLVAGTATAATGTLPGADPSAASTVITRAAKNPIPARVTTALTERLKPIAGVTSIAVIHTYPHGDINGFPQGMISCTDLASTAELGRCRPGQPAAVLPLYALDTGHTQPGTTWPSPPHPAQIAALAALPAQAIVVATTGTTATLERLRTAVTADPATTGQLTNPQTLAQITASNLADITQIQHLAIIAIGLSILIAGCSLTIAVAGSLIERRRPFSLLRLTGTPLRVLRRVILLEAAAPLIGLTIISAATGLLTAQLLVRAVRGSTIHLPAAPYYLALTLGVATALALTTATMPLLRRITTPENARTE